MFSALVCKAEDQIQVKPFAVQANTNGYVDIELINDGLKVSNIQFDLYMPDGIAVYTNSSGNLISSSIAVVAERTSYTYFDEEEEDDVTVNALSTLVRNFKEDGGVKYLAVACGGSSAVDGTSGAVLRLRYKVAENATPGVYPIIMKNILLASPTEESAKIAEAVSYVVVGEASDATLALEGTIPSFVNEALASETAIGTLDLTNVTASNGTFTYVDGRNVVAPTAEVKGNVAYKRTVSGDYASLCLPFDATVAAYTLDGIEGGYAKFSEVTTLTKNTPAIVTSNIDITAENVALGGAEAKAVTSGYYLKGGNFCSVNGSANIGAFRGWWDVPAGVKGFKLGEATAITTVSTDANEDVYNMQGVKMDKAQRGINIVGGKKLLVK